MAWLALVGAIVLYSSQTLNIKLFNLYFFENSACYFFYTMAYNTLAMALLLAVNRGLGTISTVTWIAATLYGLFVIGALLLFSLALRAGPMAFTSLITSFSMLVPIAVGCLFWGETIAVTQIFGLILLLPTLWLINNASVRTEENRGANLRWLMLCFANVLFAGGFLACSKTQQMALQGAEINEFLIINFFVIALITGLIALWRVRKKGESIRLLTHDKRRKFLLLVGCMTIGAVFGNICGLYVSSRLPAVIQFPIQSSAGLLTFAVVGAVFFKEKLTGRSVAGLVVGLASIILLGLQ